MKKLWIALALLLLTSCGGDNSNSPSVSDGNSTSTTPVSVTPVSSSNDSETPNSEYVDNSANLPNSEFVDDSQNTVETYSIIGWFMDDKNNPISNLTVGLFDASKVELASVTTDENGQFIFEELLEGKYYLRVITSSSDKYKDLDKKEWSFEVSGEYFELQLGTIKLETDNTKWSDLM